MNQLRIITCVFVVTTLACFVAADLIDENTKRLTSVEEASLEAASAIRKIEIHTKQDGVQLASMATDFIVSLNYATYALNVVVPNIDTHDERDAFVWASQRLSIFATDLQQAISKDSKQLQEGIASILVQLSGAGNQGKNVTVSNQFAQIQLQKELDFVIYGVYKLIYQANLFEMSNKELVTKLRQTIAQIEEVATNLPSANKVVEKELLNALLQGTTLVSKNIYKLQCWIEVNSNSFKDAQLIRETAITLSKLYEKDVYFINSNFTIEYLIAGYKDMYDLANSYAEKICSIQYPDNSGGNEFVRSFLFDMIAAGRVYVTNTKRVLKTVQAPKTVI